MLAALVDEISRWAVPALLAGVLLLGWLRGVKVYESFVSGAEEGFGIAVKLIPFLVAMLVSISIFRESGAMELFVDLVQPAMNLIGAPGEILPLAIMRPLSGSGALGVATELIREFGPDSFIGRLASTMQGSTDTTFFVLTLYFGSVGVKRYRHALAAGLLADLTSLLAAIWICNQVFR